MYPRKLLNPSLHTKPSKRTFKFLVFSLLGHSQIMAFRSMGYLRSMANHLRGTATYATSTQPKLKASAPTADQFIPRQENQAKKTVKGDFVPVYVAIGMICISVSLGLYTAKNQISHSPNVRVKKKTRQTIHEVTDPDKVAHDAEQFKNRSFFRKIAHIQESY